MSLFSRKKDKIIQHHNPTLEVKNAFQSTEPATHSSKRKHSPLVEKGYTTSISTHQYRNKAIYDAEEVRKRKAANDDREKQSLALQIAHRRLAEEVEKDLMVQMLMRDRPKVPVCRGPRKPSMWGLPI